MLHCPECGDRLYDFSRPGDKIFDLHCMSCGWESIANKRKCAKCESKWTYRLLCDECYSEVKKPAETEFLDDNIFVVYANNTGEPFLFDREDYMLIKGLSWVEDSYGYLVGAVKRGKLVKAHRVVMGEPECIVDHKDRNKKNNLKSNLRLVDFKTNSRNSKLQVNNTTGYKGVTKASRGNKYYATITVNGKSKHIGSYETAEEAAKNYDRMAVFYHGDDAVTNRDLGLLPPDAIYEDHKKFAEVLREVYSLARGVKSEDYGRTWAETGLVGIYIKLMIKEGRLRELVWKGKQPQVKGESIRDTLMDIAAYAVYGILCLDEDNYDGEQSRQERLQAMLLNIKEVLNNGKEEN